MNNASSCDDIVMENVDKLLEVARDKQTKALFNDLAVYRSVIQNLQILLSALEQRRFRRNCLRRLNVDILNMIIDTYPIPTLSPALVERRADLIRAAMDVERGHMSVESMRFETDVRNEAMAFVNAILKRYQLARYADAEVAALQHQLQAQLSTVFGEPSLASLCKAIAQHRPPSISPPTHLSDFSQLLITNEHINSGNDNSSN